MINSTPPQKNRRQLLRGLLRTTALGGLGLVTGTLLFRKQARLSEHECINRGLCRNCGVLKTCILPSGQSTREGLQQLNHERKTNQQNPA